MSFFAFTAIAILVIATPSENSQAEGTPEQRCACEQDAFRVCGNEIPNVARITHCMVKNVKKLSPARRAQFKQTNEAMKQNAQRP
ncbi:MAG: hypothetical protein WCB50_12910 [Pseudolabrys sp.]